MSRTYTRVSSGRDGTRCSQENTITTTARWCQSTPENLDAEHSARDAPNKHLNFL